MLAGVNIRVMTKLRQPALVLFRNDLRLDDNLALNAAIRSGRPVIPLFILDEVSEGVRPLGSARRWWLHHSLNAFTASLRSYGSRLIVRSGKTAAVATAAAAETGAAAVFWNRRYEFSPAMRTRQ